MPQRSPHLGPRAHMPCPCVLQVPGPEIRKKITPKKKTQKRKSVVAPKKKSTQNKKAVTPIPIVFPVRPTAPPLRRM